MKRYTLVESEFPDVGPQAEAQLRRSDVEAVKVGNALRAHFHNSTNRKFRTADVTWFIENGVGIEYGNVDGTLS